MQDSDDCLTLIYRILKQFLLQLVSWFHIFGQQTHRRREKRFFLSVGKTGTAFFSSESIKYLLWKNNFKPRYFFNYVFLIFPILSALVNLNKFSAGIEFETLSFFK
jgi:hypothetical protein